MVLWRERGGSAFSAATDKQEDHDGRDNDNYQYFALTEKNTQHCNSNSWFASPD